MAILAGASDLPCQLFLKVLNNPVDVFLMTLNTTLFDGAKFASARELIASREDGLVHSFGTWLVRQVWVDLRE